MNGELHNAMGDIYMDYMDIPESVVSNAEFTPMETAYRIYEANPTIENGAAFLKEASEIYDLPGVTQYTFDPQRTISTAMEADFNVRIRGMMDEAYAAGEGGMSAGEFAQAKGVPGTLTDAETMAGLTMKKMDGEGNGGYNGGDGSVGSARDNLNILPKTTEESVRIKLDTYLLEPNHPVGGSKAKWFKEALGFTKENSVDLEKQIIFDHNRAVVTATNLHGTKFSQMISIHGANGKIIVVEFIFIKNNDGIVRLVTSIPTKR